MSFSLINSVYLRKPILSERADDVGLSARADNVVFQVNPPYLRVQIIWVFSDKPGLSERTPLYLQIMWSLSEKHTLPEKNPLSDHLGFLDKPTLSADNVGFSRKT